MGQELFLRARLELELRAAQEELTRLEAERLRLARKNELLSATMYELRSDHTLPELALRKIEEALAFDGQPWTDLGGLDEDADEPDDEGDEPAADDSRD